MSASSSCRKEDRGIVLSVALYACLCQLICQAYYYIRLLVEGGTPGEEELPCTSVLHGRRGEGASPVKRRKEEEGRRRTEGRAKKEEEERRSREEHQRE
jgi:hypothetical protein